ncbi:hypothetical protein MAR_024662 [Mya arenaria]|uniref:Small EDRK-rich factor-like N-terminal domain-containing protein n=1 Tax=Mya arenaria TaxID=6604 RepID=A0ABY7DRF7_MYAAR|nr:hypothetical protein MAR_024662 [Mya arenaria]
MYCQRGNQREKSREKAVKLQKEKEKKKAAGDKGANKGLTLEERKHRKQCSLYHKSAHSAVIQLQDVTPQRE